MTYESAKPKIEHKPKKLKPIDLKEYRKQPIEGPITRGSPIEGPITRGWFRDLGKPKKSF